MAKEEEKFNPNVVGPEARAIEADYETWVNSAEGKKQIKLSQKLALLKERKFKRIKAIEEGRGNLVTWTTTVAMDCNQSSLPGDIHQMKGKIVKIITLSKPVYDSKIKGMLDPFTAQDVAVVYKA